MLKQYPFPPTISNGQCKFAARRARAGEYNHPFIIAGLSARLFTDHGVCTYQIILSPTQPDEVGLITAEEAKVIISANHMERMFTTEHGRIYELPGAPFRKQWHGYHGTQRLADVWYSIIRDAGFPRECINEEVYAYLKGDGIVICGSAALVTFLKGRLGGSSFPASRALASLGSAQFVKFEVV